MIVILLIVAGLLIARTALSSRDNSFVTPNTDELIYLKPLPQIPVKPNCSCVLFVKDFGVDIRGNANQQIPNSKEPVVGGVVILKGGKYGHIAMILEVREKEGEIVIIESNYKPCQITYRVFSIDDPKIKGYII